MARKGLFTKILAIAGALLAWLPILAPVFFSLRFVFAGRPSFNIDYLMPAELFPAVLVGGGLLIWAALRAHARLRLMAWGLGLAIAALALGQGLAVWTGLAAGETEPAGWAWVLVMGVFVIYDLLVALIGIGAGLLLRDLFAGPAQPALRAAP